VRCVLHMSVSGFCRVLLWRCFVSGSVGCAAVWWVSVVVWQRSLHGVMQLLDVGLACGFIGCVCTLLMAMWFWHLCIVSFRSVCVFACISSMHMRLAGMLCLGNGFVFVYCVLDLVADVSLDMFVGACFLSSLCICCSLL
jgi:hypothetical protein